MDAEDEVVVVAVAADYALSQEGYLCWDFSWASSVDYVLGPSKIHLRLRLRRGFRAQYRTHW